VKQLTGGKMTPYEKITDRLLDLMEQGTVPWRKPWASGQERPKNLFSDHEYRGANFWLLLSSPYASPYWVTFKQAKQLGGHIKKGEKAWPIVFWTRFTPKDDEAKVSTIEPGQEKTIPIMRSYSVFNLQQCEGINPPAVESTTQEFRPIENAETVVEEMPNRPQLNDQSKIACYKPSTDEVCMPPRHSFQQEAEYYSTLFHELTHSTGHRDRLNRKGITEKTVKFGSQTYSKEELVAEIGASLLCGKSGIQQGTLANSAAYLNGWMSRLRNDKKLFVIAAAQAEKAADYILGQNSSEERD
jgi:antirestriction protein ArdC